MHFWEQSHGGNDTPRPLGHSEDKIEALHEQVDRHQGQAAVRPKSGRKAPEKPTRVILPATYAIGGLRYGWGRTKHAFRPQFQAESLGHSLRDAFGYPFLRMDHHAERLHKDIFAGGAPGPSSSRTG